MKTTSFAVLFFTVVSPLAHGASSLVPMVDTELAKVTGQALVELQKRVGDGAENGSVGLSFTRIRLGIKAEVNANIDLVELGNYDIPHHTNDTSNTSYYSTNKNSLSADIRIRNVSLGCLQSASNSFGQASCGSGPETLRVEKPFIELAYKNDGTANEELVGLRIGFELMNGWMGGDIESLSGHVYGCDNSGLLCGESKAARSNKINAVNINWDLALLHRLQAVNTKNFFFGLQKTPINYPRAAGSLASTQITAQPGFWINLRDGITIPTGDITDVINIFSPPPRQDNCWQSASFC